MLLFHELVRVLDFYYFTVALILATDQSLISYGRNSEHIICRAYFVYFLESLRVEHIDQALLSADK